MAIVPAAAILAGVLALTFVRMRALMLEFGEDILRDRARAIVEVKNHDYCQDGEQAMQN